MISRNRGSGIHCKGGFSPPVWCPNGYHTVPWHVLSRCLVQRYMQQQVIARASQWPPGVRGLPGGLLALPEIARFWWAGTIVLALALLPWCLAVEQPSPPAAVPVL